MGQVKQPDIKSVNIHEAKTHLSRIIEDVKLLGQPVIIAKSGVPQVKLVPLQPTKQPRKMGTLQGKIHIPEDFDSALSEDIQGLFNNCKEDQIT